MSIFAKKKTLRSYLSMDIFNVSKFGSLVNFQCQYPRRQSLNRHLRLVLLLLIGLHCSVLCYPRCQLITWQGRKRKWREELGGDYSKEAINRGTAIIRGNTVSPQSRGICTDVCMVEVGGGGWGNGGPHHRKVYNFETGPPCRAISSLASDLSPLHLVSF